MNIPQTDLPGGSAAGSAPAGAGSVDGRASRWQSHREERRRELIKSARKAVHALGSDASMEDIAAAAGTSKSVFYRYFGDKAGLQQAVGEVVLSQMQRRIQEAAQSAQTPREGLLAMVSAYLQMAETSPNVYTFVTRYTPGDATSGTIATAGALGHFFAAISDMIARPMRSHLGDSAGREAVIGYWPNAAIGLVRNAGEQWLASPASPPSPTRRPWPARSPTGCASASPPSCARQPRPHAPTSAPTLSEPTKEST